MVPSVNCNYRTQILFDIYIYIYIYIYQYCWKIPITFGVAFVLARSLVDLAAKNNLIRE